MSFLSTLTILTLCGVAFGGYMKSNIYIDNVLESTRHQLQSADADPQSTSGWVYEFKDKMKFIGIVNVKVTYDTGELSGLSRVARHGNCNPPFRRYGALAVELNCTLVFHKLETEQEGKLKYGILPEVTITGKGKFDKFLVFMVVKKTSPSSKPFLQRLSIEEIGAFKPTFSGLGPLNEYLSILDENYTERMKAEVINAINGRFFRVLNRTLPLYPMPQL